MKRNRKSQMGDFDSAILMFVLERQFFKPQTAIVQIKIIG